MPITVSFMMDRETKNAFRFSEINAKGKPVEMSDAIVGTIYLKKSAVGQTAPKIVRGTFEFEMPAKGSKKVAAPAKAEAKAAPAKTAASTKKPVSVKKPAKAAA